MKNNIEPKHYTDMKISPLEYIKANNLEWNVGNVIKYVSRYKRKNGVEDLGKAAWYLNDLISEIINLEQKDNKEVCHWTEEEDGDNDYETECGMYFSINAGTPIENNMHFCPKCGNKLIVKEEKLK